MVLSALGALALILVSYLGLRGFGEDFGVLEFDLAATAPGRVQVYYDFGDGLSEAHSALVTVSPAEEPQPVRLRLPVGRYHALRIDPIDGDSVVTFTPPRIVSAAGGTLRVLAFSELLPNDQIARVERKGESIVVYPTSGANDPNFVVNFEPPLALKKRTLVRLLGGWPAPVTLLVGLLGLAWLLGTMRRFQAPLYRAAQAAPQRALWVTAAVATVAACYPVVFFGKSFVSPNNGAALLYPGPPTVPGMTDSRSEDARGADIGAMMWAHLPYSVVQHAAMFRDGELPLWNRYSSCGVTLIGQGQSMLGDPVHLLVIAAGGASWAWDAKFVVARLLFAAGLGLCVWRLTRDLTASALVAFAAPFVAFFNYRLNHPAIFSVSYAPWILFAWIEMTLADGGRRRLRGLVLWQVANLAVLGSGTAKEAYMLFIFLNLTGALGWALSPAPAGTSKRRTGAILVAGGVCSALITMPLWRTLLDALQTATTASDVPVAHQAPRAWFVGFFDDLFYRELSPGRNTSAPASNFLLMTGVLWALVQPRWLARDPWAKACLFGSLLSLSIGFQFMPAGWILATPLLRNVSHVHNTFCTVALVQTAILAGVGFHLARTRLVAPAPWRPLAIMAAILVALLTIYFRDIPHLWLDGPGLPGAWKRAATHIFFYGNLVLGLAACGLLIALARHCLRRGARLFSTLLGIAALAVLFYRHGTHLDGKYNAYLLNPMARADLAAPSAAVSFVRQEVAREPARVSGVNYHLIPGYSAVRHLENINGPDAVMNRRYREVAEAAEFNVGGDWFFPIDRERLGPRRGIMDFLGVKYLLANDPNVPADTGYVKAGSFDLVVYRSDSAWPRAFFVDRLERYATPAELVARLRTAEPRKPFAAVQAGDRMPELPADPGATRVVPAQNYRLTANTTSFSVDAPGPGMAVLHETWLPDDFRVTLNGRNVPYFRVNHAFKGIALPAAGLHHVTFSYWPRHLASSLILAALGLAGLAALIVGLRRAG